MVKNTNMFEMLEGNSLFKTTHEMDEAISSHIYRWNYDLNVTDRDVLMMIAQYSARYSGTSCLKVEKYASSLGKSVRTIQRSLRKLENLNVIERRAVYRPKSGGNASNLIVILPYDVMADMSPCENVVSVDVPCVVDLDYPDEPINLISNKDSKDINTYVSPEEHADTSYDNQSPYNRFKDAVRKFIGNKDTRTISRLYGVYLAQTHELRKAAYSHDDLIGLAINAVNSTYARTKTKNIRNVAGYFNGVVSNMLDKLYEDLMAEFAY